MTQTDELIAYYTGLVIYQYSNQPNASALVSATVTPILMPQGHNLLIDLDGNPVVDLDGNPVYDSLEYNDPILPLALQEAFNFPGATGIQLNIIAKYLGGKRTNKLLDGTNYTMGDDEFTTYLQLLAVRNGLSSDLGTIQDFLHEYFVDGGNDVLILYDHKNMSIGYLYLATPGTYPFFESFITSGHLPKPMAVGSTLISTLGTLNFFAFRNYYDVAPVGTTGYNFYVDPQIGTFVTYSYVIVVPYT